MVNIGDINQMSSAINELLDDPEKACEMGQQGREYVLRKFSIDKFKKNLQQVFEREWNQYLLPNIHIPVPAVDTEFITIKSV